MRGFLEGLVVDEESPIARLLFLFPNAQGQKYLYEIADRSKLRYDPERFTRQAPKDPAKPPSASVRAAYGFLDVEIQMYPSPGIAIIGFEAVHGLFAKPVTTQVKRDQLLGRYEALARIGDHYRQPPTSGR